MQYKGMYDENGRLPKSVIEEMYKRIRENIKKQGLTKEDIEKSLEDIKNGNYNVDDYYDEDEPRTIDAFGEIRKIMQKAMKESGKTPDDAMRELELELGRRLR